ncbi:sugar transferase [Streptomyces sp. NPDC051657]|uniref:sugar transferase n=1 Tax=unclassified Streptomyces TaxID=2593676 RepID=UPI00342E62BA
MQNARKPRVRRKNQRSLKGQASQQGHKGGKDGKNGRSRQGNKGRQVRQPGQPPPPPPRSRPVPPGAEPHSTEPHETHPHPHRHPSPYGTAAGTVRGRFPSRPAARLAGLADRAGRLADRFLPRTPAERVLDLTLGTALLLLTAPAVAVAALALNVRHTPGGAWDRRPRTGLGGRVFELRTLRTRRLRLDLFSRLPHVVRGDLSLVGPAPLAPGDPRATGSGARQWRRELRPGLTGLAQVRARSGMPWDDPALLDQHYAEHHGVVLDLAILAEAVRDPLRKRLRRARRTKAHLSDADHRRPGYSTVE